MKQVSIFLISILSALSVLANQNISTGAVTITVNGNRNLQVAVDGKTFNVNNSTSIGNKTTIILNDLEMGQHTLGIIRTGPTTNRSDRISILFNLRYGYDMLINVNGNGSLELIETMKTGISGNQVPMSDANFTNLLKSVRNQRGVAGRRSVIASAFNNTNNYFTSYQVTRLLQLVNAENYRLQLAKLSYPAIVDRNNFNQLYDLLNSQASKVELEAYVNNYNEENNPDVAMSDINFNSLYQTIQEQWSVSTQMISLVNAFKNTNNYFSTSQARQLIQLVGAESNRLQLAKLSYRSITDPVNFSQVYNLFNSQVSKDELIAYVNDYNSVRNPANNAMSDVNFNNLYQIIQEQRTVSTQVNSLTNTFTNTSNYFSTYQARQLILLVRAENDRLQLAKLSYRSITDRVNFNQVYDLFNNQASKNELEAYVNSYITGNSPTSIAMSDANFNELYQTIQLQFFPGEKMNSLTNAFNNAGYYFSCIQAKQLIQLVSLESNRLQLAKLSYRTIVDRNNFNQLYDLLSSQASRSELDAYVKAYKDQLS